uniref:DUF4283 domain-containing protein n=1 Tax=Glycine max TaxID=3847 RepID=A0A0R0I6N0_SOYBN
MNHAQSPTKPRDRGDGGSQVKVSFRDETMWEQVFKKREIRDLIAQKKFCVEYEHGDRLKPKCFEDDFILKELLDPWKEAVNGRMQAVWKLIRGFDMVGVGFGFYMVKIDISPNREKEINDGPWMIFDHYLVIISWVPDFIASEVQIEST